jgi:uracil-DNA glycosylase
VIIFVGDKPSPRMKPGAKPFQGAACEARLKAWIKALGLKRYDYTIVNSGDMDFDIYMTTDRIAYYSDYIALGNNASKALRDIPHFKLPHPSGRNRQINDEALINEKLKKCKEWLKFRQGSTE